MRRRLKKTQSTRRQQAAAPTPRANHSSQQQRHLNPPAGRPAAPIERQFGTAGHLEILDTSTASG